ncbi:MAG: 3-beta hydroxysteroid dehydrogenase [Proteobacteria bacterium SG_bin6]|nr:MAG: 3-beta hydroxysteroid dehydrogenase [Proteobacteria bacterium SG_bin6]
MKLFVTGATGFLGQRLIVELRRQRHEVFALARSAAAASEVTRLGATPVEGDLDDSAKLILPRIDAVVHAAAYFRFAGPRAPYFGSNVTGTKALIEAARRAGAATFLYVSAGAVVMDDRGSRLRDVDETAPTYPASFSAYIASKSQAEAAVLAANAPDFRTLALRPPGIWGPGDSFSRALPKMVRRRQFAFIGGGDYDYVTCHVDNVVEALIKALDRGEGGRAYFINDAEATTFRGFATGIAGAIGLSIDRAPSIPYGLAWALGSVMERAAGLVSPDRDPPMSRTMVRLIGREFVTDDAAARRELGYVGLVSRAHGLARYC